LVGQLVGFMPVITGDYDDFINYKKDDVLAMAIQAKELIEEIDKFIHS